MTGGTETLVERLRSLGRHIARWPGSAPHPTHAKTLDEAASAIQALIAALEPFAERSRAFDEAAAQMGFALSNDEYYPKTRFTHGQLRAARAALRSVKDTGNG